ncbi:MAG: hypothetical protein E7596_00460 [Ruminococcaceae bacterium]|nr:hypothetical protein [Oscillospiraceae bacterium]
MVVPLKVYAFQRKSRWHRGYLFVLGRDLEISVEAIFIFLKAPLSYGGKKVMKFTVDNKRYSRRKICYTDDGGSKASLAVIFDADIK